MALGGFDLRSVFGRIVIDPSGVDSGIRQASQSLGAGLQSMGNQLSGLGLRLTAITTPLAIFGGQGVQAASSFENALSEIGVRARLTADEMERVRTKALEIGRDTVFSSGQAAEAFLQLLTTGQTVEQAFATIDSVMAGAAASGADLGAVADSVTDIMAQFQIAAVTFEDGTTSSAGVVDRLAEAAGSSSATMQDLIAGFQNVGGVAYSFGLTVGDTAAILATFSENGIKGAEAGTQLRSMLNNMMRPTDEVQAAWRRLGTSMFDANGKMRPLNDVIRDMNVAMATMTEQERLETIQQLAGSYGQLGLTALLNSEGFGAMSEAMLDATGASEVAEAKMNTFSGAVESLRGSVETLQINALTPLMENVLRPLVQHITDVVNGINDWVVANPELAGTITGVLGLLVGLGPILIGVGAAVNLIGTSLSVLGPIIAIVTSPVGLAVGAFAGLLAVLNGLGIINLQPTIDAVGRFVGALGAGVPVGDAFLTLIGDLFGSEAEQMVQGWLQGIADFVNNVAVPALQALYNWFMTEGLPAIQSFVQNVVGPAIQGFFDIIGGVWTVVSVGLTALKDWFVTNGLPFIQGAISEASRLWGELQTGLTNLWNTVRPFVEPIVTWFRDVFQGIIDFIQPVLDAIGSIITQAGEALDMLRQIGGGAPNPQAASALGTSTYTPRFGNVPAFASGIDLVPRDMLAILHQGEGVLTAEQNRSRLDGAGGDNIHVSIVIQGGGYEAGREAARGFDEELRARRRRRG